jgi:hypothetical protein
MRCPEEKPEKPDKGGLFSLLWLLCPAFREHA